MELDLPLGATDDARGKTKSLTAPSPPLDTTVATSAWLKRFGLPGDEVMAQWRELHASPTISSSAKTTVVCNLDRLRKAIGLPDKSVAASNGSAYDNRDSG